MSLFSHWDKLQLCLLSTNHYTIQDPYVLVRTPFKLLSLVLDLGINPNYLWNHQACRFQITWAGFLNSKSLSGAIAMISLFTILFPTSAVSATFRWFILKIDSNQTSKDSMQLCSFNVIFTKDKRNQKCLLRELKPNILYVNLEQ